MSKLLEYKSIDNSIKDIDIKGRIVTGYLSDFSEDLTKDIIEPGAFTKTLAERGKDVYFLNQHDWSQPHGKFKVLQEDKKGLYFESEPLIDTSYSNDLLKLYEAGIMNEHSIGYQVVKKETKGDGRLLKELALFEGSNVTRGANPNTPFLGLKELNQKNVDIKVKQLMKAIRTGAFTDETFILLEIALKQLQSTAYELGKKSLQEPLDSTLIIEPITEINTIKLFTQNL